VFIFSCKKKENSDSLFNNSVSHLISIDKDYVFYEDYDGNITLEELKLKKNKWKHKKEHKISLKIIETKDDILYTTPSEVVSINKITGKTNFKVKESITVRTYDLYDLNDEILAVSQYGVYTFLKESGEITWSIKAPPSKLIATPRVLIHNDLIYIAGNFSAESKTTLFSFNSNNKEKISEINLETDIVTNMLLIKNKLIFATGQSNMNRKLKCLDRGDFNTLWEISHPINHSSNLILHKNKFVFFNYKDKVYNLNISDLNIVEKFKLPNNYYKLFGIYENQLICYNNSSIFIASISSLPNRFFEHIKTSGPWNINGEVYYANKNTITNLQID
jgi:outer membrane protein assembly factor BamB